MEQAKDITGQRARLVDAYKNLQLTGSPEANMPLEQFLKKYGGISMGSDMFSLSPKGMEAFKKYGG
jgi:hypothetical protein